MSEPINKIVPIGKIKPHPENYNMHPDDQLKQLGASYSELGQFRSVVLWAQTDGSYIQLAGHGVVEAMQREGATEVRADILPSSLDPVVAKRIMLADNLHAQNSSPDDELLAHLLQEQKDAGYDLAALGSSDETLRQMLAELGDGYLGSEQEEGDGGDDFDVEPEEGPTRTNVGELWQLGEHRLLVGSSTDPLQIARLMQGEKCKLIFTDPPYGVSYSGLGQNTSKQTIENDDLNPDALKVFLLQAFRAFPCDDGCNIYICHADAKAGLRPAFETAFLEAGYTLSATIIWVKNQASMGWQDYRSQHEPILYGWRRGEGRVRVEDRTMTTVWEVSRDAASSYQHPTQKPVALPMVAITNSSHKGDIVFDGFGGSGSTLIACMRSGRKARLCELDPRYADVILRRYEAESGEKATLLERSEEVAHA